MREIKFRGKRIDGKGMVYGDLLAGMGYKRGQYFILPHLTYYPADCDSYDGYNVNPETIGQYTGLKDKNGKEIYEGDVIKHSYWERAPLDMYQQGEKDEWIEEYSVVKWDSDDCKFYTIKFDVNIWSCEDYEVIGNIHDNPELIKEEEK